MKLSLNGEIRERLRRVLGRYKYVLIVIAAGILLMIWPSQEKREAAGEQPGLAGGEEDFSVEALEERLSQALSRMDGAGEVTVILTVQTGMERVLATNRSAVQKDSSREMEEEVVIISGSSGDEAVLVGQRYPVFQGALVICTGGDDPQVRLRLTQAVAALTGLGTDRIAVCKGE